MSKYTVAVVGATGVVGQEIIKTLEQRKFPVKELVCLTSARSEGTRIEFNGKYSISRILDENSFEGVDYALFSAGGSISEKFAPIAVKAGAVVIDNTSHFRMDPSVPLVVPEVNAQAVKKHKGIIANPNCSTAQMVLALKPLHDAAKIKRVVISTYQSVSGAGKEAIKELESQTRHNLQGKPSEAKQFTKDIAFNVIPHIDVFEDNGYTKEEMKMILETQKILEDDTIKLTATTVRVPVFIGHSEALNVELSEELPIEKVRDLLRNMPGVVVMDNPSKNEYPTPKLLAGRDETFVGRIRKDISNPKAIDMWVVSDNLRKGAALNAVQIAEELIK
ncbi:aspartate-semialdehyde dehydrogenase [Candidatus Marinamargulisbacteria bacterium SCGC AAA071-K20]|nr:aspartate-semialdehyde dehydrogenase [Candidatus Marinamargulisbacteria bacterium SCGC AAA071-K20]